MCISCENCSDESCIRFFAIWDIVWGIDLSFIYIVAAFQMTADDSLFDQIFIYGGCACAPLFFLAGIFLFVGYLKDKPVLFKLGLYLSTPLPIVLLSSIFLPILQLIALLKLCRYARNRWP